MINNIYQAKYRACELSQQYAFANVEKLIPIYMKTGIQIYPHQIMASIFALSNPFSKGYILCDEVGLGKGIEAMLVVSQMFYDGKQKIVIVVPQPLLSQWKKLLGEQFGLPFAIYDDNFELNEENLHDKILLTTYKYASDNYQLLKKINWDLAVFEEAHRLRKFYTNENKTATNLHMAFESTRKLLLTATPMQKNVMDLYGLINFIDDGIFTSPDEFYKRYYKKPENYPELRELIKPYTFRTLRSQVKADVSLPERVILTHEYKLEDSKEKQLNDLLTKYITKPKKYAFPDMDPYELNLMLQKIFSSSIYAISKTLASVFVRLNKMANKEAIDESVEIQKMLDLATSITQTSKGKIFLKTLEQGFKSLADKGQNKKIIVFTENTQTQEYLQKLIMQKTKYKAVIYNGTTGESILDDFKNKAQILITTDNANEGFNFEFCNFIINYDNPWNILSLEQRIGRCHRIGQTSDVCVVYFICREIFSDVRFYELAFKRLNMFNGIMGASDTVISDVSSSNINESIAQLISNSRNKEEVQNEYEQIQEEYKDYIEENKQETNKILFNTFDEELIKKTKNYVALINKKSKELKEKLWEFVKYALKSYASFNDEEQSLFITRSLYKSGNIFNMSYKLNFTTDTPQSERLTLNCKDMSQILSMIQILTRTESGKLILDGSKTNLKGLKGKLALYSLNFIGQNNSYKKYMFVGLDQNNNEISPIVCEEIINLPCVDATETYVNNEIDTNLIPEKEREQLKALMENKKPQIENEIKENCEQLTSNEIKRAKSITENKKLQLRYEIDKFEKELNKIKCSPSGNNFNDEFIINQQKAEISKRLNKLKETEFLEKMNLNKQLDQKIKEINEKIKYYYMNSLEFMVYFEVR